MSLKKMHCTLGVFDIPIIQLQPPFVVDLLDSNIALFGLAMSGKTTFVKMLVNILHKQYDESQEQVFILDFGGALSEYKELPLVSAYFDNSNEEYVKRVFKIMDNLLKDNIRQLNGKNFRDSEIQPIHTTFIIDNLNAFMEEPRYTAYQEKLAKLCRDGLSKGITIVVTAVDTKGLTSYLGNFKQKIAFDMPGDKYSEIFTGKVGMIGNNPGHGFANVTVKPKGVTGTFRMNLPYEVQTTLPYNMEGNSTKANTEETFVEKLKVKFRYENNTYLKSVKKYQTFPKELTRDEYDTLKQTPEDMENESKEIVSVGLDYVDFYPVTVDLEQSHVIAIYGKKDFGKTNLLNLLVDGFIKQKQDAQIILFDDGRNQLKPLYESYKDKVDCTIINKFEEVELALNDGTKNIKKLSPLQQFYVYLNENHITLDKRFLGAFYGTSKEMARDQPNIKGYLQVPDCKNRGDQFTIFVIQSKLVYLSLLENKRFIETILPQLVAEAKERGYVFIFSDVQKISDGEQNTFFNNVISNAFLLDNIAEFAGDRGQKTVFGNMDIKALKEDYARCEKGDGYFFDIEADNLLKLKFIKY
jgi:DNA segregation ATPase FtsK/SpoIIIE and related proteins